MKLVSQSFSDGCRMRRIRMPEISALAQWKILPVNPFAVVKCKFYVRGRSDKYLASPLDGATIAKETYCRVVHSRRRSLSKFQSDRTRNFVLTACGIGRVREFYKNGRKAISVGVSILVFGSEIAQRNQRALGCCVRGLFSFDGDRQKLI